MKAAILETGVPPGGLAERFGTYPDMFRTLLGDEWIGPSYDVAANELPRPEEHGAWLITGSPAGVYEDRDWIARLLDFLRAVPARTRLVGICFGHQAMAQAYGGRVEKSGKGWGIGLSTYDILHREPWMDDAATVSIPASHQDQVVEQPPGTEAIAASAFTPFAGLAWRHRAAISFQFHPEFEPDYAKALIEIRRDRLPDPDAAIATLDHPNDNRRVGGWIRTFLTA